MGPLPIPPQGLIAAPLVRVLRSAQNRVLVAEKQLVNDGSEYFRALTVGNCQLPSRGTLGGSFDAIPLFARTEARVIRGIVKGVISICSPGRKFSQLGEECALQTAQRR